MGRHQLRNVALAIATAEELANQGFRDHAGVDRTRNSPDPLAGAFPGAACDRDQLRNMFSTWPTIRREHGRCAPLFCALRRIGRLIIRLWSDARQSHLPRWPKFCSRSASELSRLTPDNPRLSPAGRDSPGSGRDFDRDRRCARCVLSPAASQRCTGRHRTGWWLSPVRFTLWERQCALLGVRV